MLCNAAVHDTGPVIPRRKAGQRAGRLVFTAGADDRLKALVDDFNRGGRKHALRTVDAQIRLPLFTSWHKLDQVVSADRLVDILLRLRHGSHIYLFIRGEDGRVR